MFFVYMTSALAVEVAKLNNQVYKHKPRAAWVANRSQG